MKVFVWSDVAKLTDNYHSGGGLIVFAENEERARELAENQGVKFGPNENPDDVRIVRSGVEKVYVMQDAGCC